VLGLAARRRGERAQRRRERLEGRVLVVEALASTLEPLRMVSFQAMRASLRGECEICPELVDRSVAALVQLRRDVVEGGGGRRGCRPPWSPVR
jgi:hypothetical protein